MVNRDRIITQVVKTLKRLAFDDHDTFAIAEFRVPREGAREEVYYDRFKAMAMLMDIVSKEDAQEDTTGYYAALEAATRARKAQEEADPYEE